MVTGFETEHEILDFILLTLFVYFICIKNLNDICSVRKRYLGEGT